MEIEAEKERRFDRELVKDKPLCIVGVGASAGGLEAIEKLLGHFPIDSRCAFVVVQHLSPDFKSLMNELLSRHTAMKIHGVADGQLVESNHIYLAPPKSNVEFANGRLWLKSTDNQRALNLPIDHFFLSLAKSKTSKAVAVVLSGTGTDGTKGASAVREANGLVIVQDPRSATFDGMPRSAIASGSSQIICRPEEMFEKILDFMRSEGMPPTIEEQSDLEDAEILANGDIDGLFLYFRKRYSVDFSSTNPPRFIVD